jgi:hypothetical protein
MGRILPSGEEGPAREEHLERRSAGRGMNAYPIKLTYHVRSYYFGERLIPELLGKKDAPEGVVAETWEVSDYR